MKYTYKEIIMYTYTALDLIPDLKRFFQKGMPPTHIMNDIYDAISFYHIYDNTPVTQYMEKYKDFFQNDIFNWITESEFIAYCERRFPEIKWGHQIIEEYWIAEIGNI